MNTQYGALRNGRKLLGTALAVVLLIAAVASVDTARAESPNDILVIASPAIKVKSITVEDLRDMFLKKRTNWSSGEKVVPLNVADNAKLREEFRNAVLEMSPSEEQSYWQIRKIKEGDSDPPALGNVLKAVFKLRGAVSYIYRSQYKAGVTNVLLVLPNGSK